MNKKEENCIFYDKPFIITYNTPKNHTQFRAPNYLMKRSIPEDRDFLSDFKYNFIFV